MAFGAKIKLTVDTSGQAKFRKEIQGFVNAATEKNPIILKKVKIELSKQERSRIFSDIQNDLNAAGNKELKLEIKHIGADTAIKNLRKQLEYMLSGLGVTGLKDFLGSSSSSISSGVTKTSKDLENLTKKATTANASLRELKQIQSTLNSAFSQIGKLPSNVDATQYISTYESLNQRVEELTRNESERSAEAISNLAKESIALKQKLQGIKEQEAATKAAAKAAAKASEDEIASYKKVAALQQQIVKFQQANPKTTRDSTFGKQITSMLNEINSGVPLSKKRVNELTEEFARLKTEAQSSGKIGASVFDIISKAYEKFGGWALITKSMSAAVRYVKEMITNVIALDTAMTELKKVTDLTDSAYEKFLADASVMAKNIGATIADTVNATADFARLGFDVDEASSLAKAALVYKNVGDGIEDISEATESLTSTVKAFEAFGVAASDAMFIVDKFNIIGNNFAISSEGIGTALKKSASSLAAAGNNLDESIAMIAAMNSVVQNPEVVGTTIKTLSMYLRAAKTEAEEAGESTEGMANSVSELRSELLKLTNNRLDIMIDSENFKSTYQIMKELSEIWDSITDIDRANILELIGGKRNATAVTSLLTNFADAEAAVVSAAGASGSALAENAKYLDSIQGKLNKFTTTFESLSSKAVDSNLIKDVVDTGTKGLELLEGFVTMLGGVPAKISLIAAAGAGLNKIFGPITSIKLFDDIKEKFSAGKPNVAKSVVPANALVVILNESIEPTVGKRAFGNPMLGALKMRMTA